MSHIALSPQNCTPTLGILSQQISTDDNELIEDSFTPFTSNTFYMHPQNDVVIHMEDVKSGKFMKHWRSQSFKVCANFVLAGVESLPIDHCCVGLEDNLSLKQVEKLCNDFIVQFGTGMHKIAFEICGVEPQGAIALGRAHAKFNASKFYDFIEELEACVEENGQGKKSVQQLHTQGMQVLQECINSFNNSKIQIHQGDDIMAFMIIESAAEQLEAFFAQEDLGSCSLLKAEILQQVDESTEQGKQDYVDLNKMFMDELESETPDFASFMDACIERIGEEKVKKAVLDSVAKTHEPVH